MKMLHMLQTVPANVILSLKAVQTEALVFSCSNATFQVPIVGQVLLKESVGSNHAQWVHDSDRDGVANYS